MKRPLLHRLIHRSALICGAILLALAAVAALLRAV